MTISPLALVIDQLHEQIDHLRSTNEKLASAVVRANADRDSAYKRATEYVLEIARLQARLESLTGVGEETK